MAIHILKQDLEQMGNWWYKLIFLCNEHENYHTQIPLLNDLEKLNINFILSKNLINKPKEKYPLYIIDILVDEIKNVNKIYLLQHIDILFDPELQINPVRLFENLSKTYKLVVEWPGRYVDGQLIYAEYGHPEYFKCDDFEGKIVMK